MRSPMFSIDFSHRSILVFASFQPLVSHSAPCPRGNSCTLKRLHTLFLSFRSFRRSLRLFSTACRLFYKNTRGGIPSRDTFRRTDPQKRAPISPFAATLTHSCSRKSFACHSYENTRDGYPSAKNTLPLLVTRHSSLASRLGPLRFPFVQSRGIVLTARGISQCQ